MRLFTILMVTLYAAQPVVGQTCVLQPHGYLAIPLDLRPEIKTSSPELAPDMVIRPVCVTPSVSSRKRAKQVSLTASSAISHAANITIDLLTSKFRR